MSAGAPLNRCVDCNEIISHPMCSDCLADNIRVFVSEYDLQLAADVISSPIYGNTKCLFCGQKMGLCPRCYSRDIYFLLQQKNSKLAKEFLSRFDFDLRKEFH